MTAFWSTYGATASEAAELESYADTPFDAAAFNRPIESPMPDEPFIGAWETYAADAVRVGVADSLRARLVQLTFPIAEGISRDPAYLAATRRGIGVEDRAGDTCLQFVNPAAMRLFIHPTVAGRVPVIVAEAREDFVALVQALTCRNEPTPIPESMGACIVAGYNNWDRVLALKRRWQGTQLRSDAEWSAAFAEMLPQKALYQDRFIILSSGPYSGVRAGDVGVLEDDWKRISLTIRLEHECAHYFTRKVLGAMRNALIDELIADFAGITAATGRYRADWFLRFLGVETPSRCRPGGRMHNYRGAPSLSDGAFAVLQVVVRRAAAQLEQFQATHRPGASPAIERARTIVALARIGLEGVASDDAQDRLGRAVEEASALLHGIEIASDTTTAVAG